MAGHFGLFPPIRRPARELRPLIVLFSSMHALRNLVNPAECSGHDDPVTEPHSGTAESAMVGMCGSGDQITHDDCRVPVRSNAYGADLAL